MSQIRMQNHFGAVRAEERYYIDADLLREIKQVSITGRILGYSLNFNNIRQLHSNVGHLFAISCFSNCLMIKSFLFFSVTVRQGVVQSHSMQLGY